MSTKGKTYEEIYGVERARELRNKRSKTLKGRRSKLKGRTYEEIHGLEKAEELREAKRGQNNPIHGLTEEGKKKRNKKLSIKMKERVKTDEYINPFSRKEFIEENRKRLTNRIVSEETGRRISEAKGKRIRFEVTCPCGKKVETLIGSRKYCSQECYHKFYKHKPSCGNKPSSYEIKVINLRIKDLEFVGDHKFWITFENGKNKCPDFVLRPFSKTHTVIEVWGRYWHDKNGDDYRLVQEEYKKLDYNVLFLFDEDFKKDEKYIKRVVKYVDENKKN